MLVRWLNEQGWSIPIATTIRHPNGTLLRVIEVGPAKGFKTRIFLKSSAFPVTDPTDLFPCSGEFTLEMDHKRDPRGVFSFALDAPDRRAWKRDDRVFVIAGPSPSAKMTMKFEPENPEFVRCPSVLRMSKPFKQHWPFFIMRPGASLRCKVGPLSARAIFHGGDKFSLNAIP